MNCLVTPNYKILFGIGSETGVGQVSEMLEHARFADDAGLDLVSVGDHPYFADRLDAYAALWFVLGVGNSALSTGPVYDSAPGNPNRLVPCASSSYPTSTTHCPSSTGS